MSLLTAFTILSPSMAAVQRALSFLHRKSITTVQGCIYYLCHDSTKVQCCKIFSYLKQMRENYKLWPLLTTSKPSIQLTATELALLDLEYIEQNDSHRKKTLRILPPREDNASSNLFLHSCNLLLIASTLGLYSCFSSHLNSSSYTQSNFMSEV